MTNDDKERFSKAILVVAQLFDKELSGAVIGLYFEALEQFSIKQVEDAISKTIKSCKFFPKPVEIIELISDGPGKIEDRAEVQASEVVWAVRHIGVYRSLQFNDPVTTAVIQQCWGGWIQLCSELLQDEEKWFRKDFIKYYRAYHNQGIAYNGHLMGMIESDNLERYDDYVPKPILVNDFKKQKLIEMKCE